MNQSIFKGSSLAALFVAALFGLSSCQKDRTDSPVQSPEVVALADFSMAVEGPGASTKASVSDGFLYWQVGDKIVMASNGQINGTLVCNSVDASNVASFSGTITDFTPAGVNLFFLGNKAADGMNPEFDLSKQSGTMDKAASYLFLKKTGVKLEETTPGVYQASESVAFEGVTSILNVGLAPNGSPGADGALATSVQINNLKNAFSINLADGSVTPSFIKAADGTTDVKVTTVAPSNVMQYSNSYCIAVVPQNATNLTMRVDYLASDGSTETTQWSDINWDMTDLGGKIISTDWEGGKAPTIVESSMKGGYSGQAVEGGENADGQNHKGGYNGATVGDQVDNPSGQKPGYSGAEVL